MLESVPILRANNAASTPNRGRTIAIERAHGALEALERLGSHHSWDQIDAAIEERQGAIVELLDDAAMCSGISVAEAEERHTKAQRGIGELHALRKVQIPRTDRRVPPRSVELMLARYRTVLQILEHANAPAEVVHQAVNRVWKQRRRPGATETEEEMHDARGSLHRGYILANYLEAEITASRWCEIISYRAAHLPSDGAEKAHACLREELQRIIPQLAMYNDVGSAVMAINDLSVHLPPGRELAAHAELCGLLSLFRDDDQRVVPALSLARSIPTSGHWDALPQLTKVITQARDVDAVVRAFEDSSRRATCDAHAICIAALARSIVDKATKIGAIHATMFKIPEYLSRCVVRNMSAMPYADERISAAGYQAMRHAELNDQAIAKCRDADACFQAFEMLAGESTDIESHEKLSNLAQTIEDERARNAAFCALARVLPSRQPDKALALIRNCISEFQSQEQQLMLLFSCAWHITKPGGDELRSDLRGRIANMHDIKACYRASAHAARQAPSAHHIQQLAQLAFAMTHSDARRAAVSGLIDGAFRLENDTSLHTGLLEFVFSGERRADIVARLGDIRAFPSSSHGNSFMPILLDYVLAFAENSLQRALSISALEKSCADSAEYLQLYQHARDDQQRLELLRSSISAAVKAPPGSPSPMLHRWLRSALTVFNDHSSRSEAIFALLHALPSADAAAAHKDLVTCIASSRESELAKLMADATWAVPLGAEAHALDTQIHVVEKIVDVKARANAVYGMSMGLCEPGPKADLEHIHKDLTILLETLPRSAVSSQIIEQLATVLPRTSPAYQAVAHARLRREIARFPGDLGREAIRTLRKHVPVTEKAAAHHALLESALKLQPRWAAFHEENLDTSELVTEFFSDIPAGAEANTFDQLSQELAAHADHRLIGEIAATFPHLSLEQFEKLNEHVQQCKDYEFFQALDRVVAHVPERLRDQVFPALLATYRQRVLKFSGDGDSLITFARSLPISRAKEYRNVLNDMAATMLRRGRFNVKNIARLAQVLPTDATMGDVTALIDLARGVALVELRGQVYAEIEHATQAHATPELFHQLVADLPDSGRLAYVQCLTALRICDPSTKHHERLQELVSNINDRASVRDLSRLMPDLLRKEENHQLETHVALCKVESSIQNEETRIAALTGHAQYLPNESCRSIHLLMRQELGKLTDPEIGLPLVAMLGRYSEGAVGSEAYSQLHIQLGNIDVSRKRAARAIADAFRAALSGTDDSAKQALAMFVSGIPNEATRIRAFEGMVGDPDIARTDLRIVVQSFQDKELAMWAESLFAPHRTLGATNSLSIMSRL